MKDKLTPKQKKLMINDIKSKQLELFDLETKSRAMPHFAWSWDKDIKRLTDEISYLKEFLHLVNTAKRK